MQIVIDIDEDLYKHIKNSYIFREGMRTGKSFMAVVYNAIANGKPLPKGHGVLKDVTNLMRGLYTDMQTEEMIFTSSEVYKLIDEECPTTIEADKESEG